MDSDYYWKTFESTGGVLEYLHYKQQKQAETGANQDQGENFANGNSGSGFAGSEGGGE